MPPLKFRAWRKKDKIFIKPGDLNYKILIAMNGEILAYEAVDDMGRGGTEIDDDIVITQSTGIKDKNGWEIFVGDIVMETFDHDSSDRRYKMENNLYSIEYGIFTAILDEEYPVEWKHMGVRTRHLKSKRIGPFFHMDGVEYEIIGNIFRNPELLK